MKKIVFIAMAMWTIAAQAQIYPSYSKGQSRVSYSDPSVDEIKITGISNEPTEAGRLAVGQPARLSFKVANNSNVNAVPAGTIQLKITLGSKLKLVSNDLTQYNNLPLTNYFDWSVTSLAGDGQSIITGKLHSDLPANFSGNVSFTVLPWKEGSSTITSQMLISNDDGITILSDILPSNNYVLLDYANLKPYTLKFLHETAQVFGCKVAVNWAVADPDFLTRKFTVENTGNTGNFLAAAEVNPTAQNTYNIILDNINSKTATIRIKAEALNGNVVYSNTINVGNLCTGRLDFSISPNPVSRETPAVVLNANGGLFNGRYTISLTDAAGRKMMNTAVTCKDEVQIKFTTGSIAPGMYMLSVTGEDGKAFSKPFLKL